MKDIFNIPGGSCKKPQEVTVNYGVGGKPQELQIQFSSDTVNWHDTFIEGDLYRRERVGESGTWTVIPLYPPADVPESSETGFIQV